MTVKEFVTDYLTKKIANNRVNPNAVSEYLCSTLQIRQYIPFHNKRIIAEKIVKENTMLVDGVKKNDPIGQYVSFIIEMLKAHTNLEFSDDMESDYDALCESGLLTLIINEFQTDYSECDILLKMALASELEDNNLNIMIGKILNGGGATIDIAKLLNIITKISK